MIGDLVGEVVGNLVGSAVAELASRAATSCRRAWRAVGLRTRPDQRPSRLRCAVRVTEGVHDGLTARWRCTTAALAPGRIDLDDVELQVRRIEETGPGRHRLPPEEAMRFRRSFMWVLRISTDHAVVEWAIPQTDLEWAVPLVTGRVTQTVQDSPSARA